MVSLIVLTYFRKHEKKLKPIPSTPPWLVLSPLYTQSPSQPTHHLIRTRTGAQPIHHIHFYVPAEDELNSSPLLLYTIYKAKESITLNASSTPVFPPIITISHWPWSRPQLRPSITCMSIVSSSTRHAFQNFIKSHWYPTSTLVLGLCLSSKSHITLIQPYQS